MWSSCVATCRSSTAFWVSAKLTPSHSAGEGFFALVATDRRRGEHGAKLCSGPLFVAGTTMVDLLGATALAGLHEHGACDGNGRRVDGDAALLCPGC